MTYASLSSLGADCPPDCYSSYWRLWQSTDDVYVIRLHVSGVPEIASSSAALLWAKAVGQKQRQKDLNVNGVAIESRGAGNWVIEVVLTSSSDGSVSYQLGWRYDDDTLGRHIEEHPDIVAEWPNASVGPAQWLELEGPASALSFWLSSPVLWAHYLSSPGGFGGPSASYGSGMGAWKGSAAARQVQLQPQPVVPVGKKPPAGEKSPKLSTAVVAAAGILILWLAIGSGRKATT